MKCTKCGSEIREGATFCTVCGTPVMSKTASNQDSQMTSGMSDGITNSTSAAPNLFASQESLTNNQMSSQTLNSVANNQSVTPVMSKTASNQDSQMTSGISNGITNSTNVAPNLFARQESLTNNQMSSQTTNNLFNNQADMSNNFASQTDMINNQNGFNSQANMNNVQPPYNNMVNNMPAKKKPPIGLIIGIIVVVIAVIAVLIGISMFNKDDTNNNDTSRTNTQTDINEDNNDAEQLEEEVQTVTYGNYIFTIPADFTATQSNNQLFISSNDYSLNIALTFQTGTSYDALASAKDQLVSLLETQEGSTAFDFTNAITTENTYEGTRFLITSGIKQGSLDLDITYAETDGGVFVVSLTKNGTLTERNRQELYSIVASANQSNF